MFKREPILDTETMENTVKMIEEQNKIQQALRDERYKNIINFILNNSKLNYDQSRLIIDYGEVVLEYIKAIEPEKYKEKYNELKPNAKED